MAERVGFEPTLPFRVNTLSKRAPSATRPSLPRRICRSPARWWEATAGVSRSAAEICRDQVPFDSMARTAETARRRRRNSSRRNCHPEKADASRKQKLPLEGSIKVPARNGGQAIVASLVLSVALAVNLSFPHERYCLLSHRTSPHNAVLPTRTRVLLTIAAALLSRPRTARSVAHRIQSRSA